MKRTHYETPFACPDAHTGRLFDEHAVFLDIETTGFSSARSQVYLIGCAYRSNGQVCTDQFFAEQPSEEADVLAAFLELLAGYRTVITFNGTGFDLPFLEARCARCQLAESLRELRSLDIFKEISRTRLLLRLPDYKQKTIEKFLNLPREDAASGGELADVYRSYVQNPTAEGSRLLHLHNFEDVIGMTRLLPMLSYPALFDGAFSVLSACTESYRCYDGSIGEELILTLQNDYPVPRRVSCKSGEFFLSADAAKTVLRVPVCQDELRYFYPNYRDYYYLPAEDMAIHKSVASYVDRDCRQPARASSCYTRRTGSFLPQYAGVIQPEFRREYRDKLSYFELTEDFLSSNGTLRRYAEHILDYISHTKHY